jgi:hypothetical protein
MFLIDRRFGDNTGLTELLVRELTVGVLFFVYFY